MPEILSILFIGLVWVFCDWRSAKKLHELQDEHRQTLKELNESYDRVSKSTSDVIVDLRQIIDKLLEERKEK